VPLVETAFAIDALTYYRPQQQTLSFRIVADQHVRWLRELGMLVVECDLDFDADTLARSEPRTPLAIVHPLFFFSAWHGLTFEAIVEALARRHRVVAGVEVADSTRISPRFAAWADHPAVAGLMLPSRFSLSAFRDSGVRNALELVPHGVSTVQPSARFDDLRADARPKALFFATFFGHRKGWDLVRDLMAELDECLFVVKGFTEAAAYFGEAENVLTIDEWLTEPDLASLYVNCDFLVSLHRGGAFEMHCADAAAYGLPVVATRFGGVTDYLTSDTSYLVDALATERLEHPGSDHCGDGAVPDVAAAVRITRELLSELPDARRRATRNAIGIRARYSWRRAAERIVAFMHQRAASA
jgi:glycosyltransferase involved in cell wall biosynthesis